MTPRRPSSERVRSQPDSCEHCGQPLEPGTRIDVIAADSTYLDPTDHRQDGRRPARVCSPDHARVLVEHGARHWIQEQLWAHELIRGSGLRNRSETTLDGIAKRAGLAPSQVLRAINWRTDPTRQERGPGGRDPNTRHSDHGHCAGPAPNGWHCR